ncbi:MAG: DNA polymerase III subunit alpha [Chlamydiota bacterium]
MSWVSLHTHSQYSILSAATSVKALAKRAQESAMPALALTDFTNMFGAVDFFIACRDLDLQPIIGCEVMVAPNSRLEKNKIAGESIGYRLILLAKDQVGYRNLCKIVSIGYLEGFYYTPRVDREVLELYSAGLICLSGPLYGRISKLILANREADLDDELNWCQKTYGEDFYFELQRHKMSAAAVQSDRMEQESWLYQYYLDYINGQKQVEAKILELSQEKGIACVATNDIHYLNREDWQAHEILLNVQSGQPCEIIKRDSFGVVKERLPNPKRKVMPSHEFYFKSPAEMEALFADLPEALKTSLEIADKCTLELDFKTKYYPVFVPPSLEEKQVSEKERSQAAARYLQELCENGIEQRYTKEQLHHVAAKYPHQDPLEVVKERLASELKVIISKGLCDYLLIVYDFIAWAKQRGIPVGPGRGSGVGSIILYLIGITDIEPLRFSLFFERFINPERVSYPDIDVDICMDRRAEVIEYTVERYGKDKVAQIITFGTMKAKMAIKDVGRVLDVPLAKVNEVAKLIPEDPRITLEKAMAIEPALEAMAAADSDVKRILAYAKKLEGSIRNTGIHAAGLIICGDPLTDHIPICTVKGSDMVATQYSMKPVEAVGMLKIDFLGLKTLTSIQKTVTAIERSCGKKIDWVDLPLENQQTFQLLNQGKTLGVFQLESAGMRDLVKELHVDKFEELIAVVALYRPGPMEMIPAFIDRKHGRTAIEIDHPLIEEIIRETYGIMVYQEQVMQAASLLAKYSLAEGDVLRRAMGKKDINEMAKQREKFRCGAVANGIKAETAMAIFDKMEKFASYGFNKSHATAYGYLCYVTAYLKANYPRDWMAALMTCDQDDVSKVAKHIRECEATGIQILPPDVNEAGLEFSATKEGIRFAMSGIKGVGLGVVEAILAERERGGEFRSLANFISRVSVAKVTKKAVENLIVAGSFDFTQWDRGALMASLEPLFKKAAREQKEQEKGVLDLFASWEKERESDGTPPDVEPLPKRKVLAKEKELLGFYLTGHPMDDYRELCRALQCQSFAEIEALPHEAVCRVAFIIENLKIKVSAKTQRKFAILTISDGIEHLELPIWAHLYESQGDLFIEGKLLYAILQLDKEGERMRLRCHRVADLAAITEQQVGTWQEAYEQLVKTLKRKGKKLREKKQELGDMKTLCLKCNADALRLSQIIQLKKIFQTFVGPTPLSIEFYSDEHKIATLSIDAQWGVRWDNELEEKLKACTFVHLPAS